MTEKRGGNSPIADRPDLVIGVGHSFRCDDGVGPFVARRLADKGLAAVAHEGEGSALLDLWEDRSHVVVVDAVAGGEAGAIARLDGRVADLSSFGFIHSTHDLGLPEAVALGRRLDRMPANLTIIGVRGRDFSMGETMTEAVRTAAERVIAELETAMGR